MDFRTLAFSYLRSLVYCLPAVITPTTPITPNSNSSSIFSSCRSGVGSGISDGMGLPAQACEQLLWISLLILRKSNNDPIGGSPIGGSPIGDPPIVSLLVFRKINNEIWSTQ